MKYYSEKYLIYIKKQFDRKLLFLPRKLLKFETFQCSLSVANNKELLFTVFLYTNLLQKLPELRKQLIILNANVWIITISLFSKTLSQINITFSINKIINYTL